MPPAMNQEDLFSCAGELDGTPCTASKLAGADFVREGVAFAAEAAADIGRDHPNMRLRDIEHFAQLAVNVMGRLRGRPEGQFAANAPLRSPRVEQSAQYPAVACS